MSVTAASGFAASGVRAGIRRSGLDLAVVRSDAASVGAAMWTTNRVQAAPVVVSKKHLAPRSRRRWSINAGVANAATGEGGIADAERTAAETATALGLRSDEVVVLSTGVIGVPLPMDRVLAGVREACATLDAGGGGRAAAAILTTDRSPKQAVVQGDGFTVGGMAKGAGMIHPRLATMLALITTDYPLAPGEPSEFLRPPSSKLQQRSPSTGSARRTMRWCCSRTARAASSARESDDQQFAAALRRRVRALAREIVADGEGATVLLEIGVSGAASSDEAEAVARRIATSPLVKTAAVRTRAELGSRAGGSRFGALERRVRATSTSTGSRVSFDGSDGLRSWRADRCAAGAGGRGRRDRARPRARCRRGLVSRVRSHI